MQRNTFYEYLFGCLLAFLIVGVVALNTQVNRITHLEHEVYAIQHPKPHYEVICYPIMDGNNQIDNMRAHGNKVDYKRGLWYVNDVPTVSAPTEDSPVTLCAKEKK